MPVSPIRRWRGRASTASTSQAAPARRTASSGAAARHRACLVRPRIMFVDEPSSAMDFATERSFLARLSQTLDPAQTLLIATHRFSMLNLVDRLIVVEGGRIVADGPKDQVMAAL